MRIRDDEAVHWASIVRQWLVLGGTQLVDTGEFLMALGQYRACMPLYQGSRRAFAEKYVGIFGFKTTISYEKISPLTIW